MPSSSSSSGAVLVCFQLFQLKEPNHAVRNFLFLLQTHKNLALRALRAIKPGLSPVPFPLIPFALDSDRPSLGPPPTNQNRACRIIYAKLANFQDFMLPVREEAVSSAPNILESVESIRIKKSSSAHHCQPPGIWLIKKEELILCIFRETNSWLVQTTQHERSAAKRSSSHLF